MTTSELIRLLQKHEYGSSGRARTLSISVKDKRENYKTVFSEKHILVFMGSGDGVAGAELELEITNKQI